MKTRTLLQEIASRIQARANCIANANTLWEERHTDWLEYCQRNWLPSGSGIDSGTKIDLGRSSRHKVVLTTSFHHMNEGGMYDGWTEHTITITPAFDGFDMTISGRNRNDIKEYLNDVYGYCLGEPITEAQRLHGVDFAPK